MDSSFTVYFFLSITKNSLVLCSSQNLAFLPSYSFGFICLLVSLYIKNLFFPPPRLSPMWKSHISSNPDSDFSFKHTFDSPNHRFAFLKFCISVEKIKGNAILSHWYFSGEVEMNFYKHNISLLFSHITSKSSKTDLVVVEE